MPNLQAAHRGYEYQDLLTASRLVDLVLGTLSAAHVDVKHVDDDRFDDLTVITVDGRRERTQFKHTDNDDRPLTVDTFTTDGRDLRLDRLVAAAVADRDGPGSAASDLAFRVVLRDTQPVDEALTAVLVPAVPDPGPFISGMQTRRLRFDVDRLWPLEPHQSRPAKKTDRSRFDFLRSGTKSVDRADLAWLCARLVIEVEAPMSSGDMSVPGPAERILLTRVRAEVGAESYPNTGRSAEDVAEAFTTFARQARQGLSTPTAETMLQRAQLRRDFGAVSRVHPVDSSIEVDRRTAVADVRALAVQAASQGAPLVLTGPPGQGKSWACDRLVRDLVSAGWLVAEHYCYLNDTLDERDERVQAEAVFGSLLGRLAEADPSLVEAQRPRYAADDVALANAVTRAVTARSDRRVALVVDGLDHVARILPARPGSDPSAALASALAGLDLPAGSALIVLSQPGDHLAPLRDAGALIGEIPSLTEAELATLAAKLGVVGPDGTGAPVDEQQADGFLALLEERSRGNALYATYLCREVLVRPHSPADPEAVLHSLPPFDGTLENYYDHLTVALGPASTIADVLGLLDFPMDRTELAEMRPDLAHWLDDALVILAPVLVERATQGGLRVYHESFARFLRRRMETHPRALTANLRFVVDWLEARGFYRDERAFRFLLPTLAAAGRDDEVLDLVDVDFATNAVAHGHPASAIAANLVVATSCAGRRQNLPMLVRCVELARAAQSFEYERLDSVVADYIDIPLTLLGSEEFAGRLMFEGKIAVPPRAGLQLCAAIDAAGAVAPWKDYIPAFAKWDANDNTHYMGDSDHVVALAWVRGQMRQAKIGDESKRPWHDRIARFLDDTGLSYDDLIPVVADVIGVQFTAELVDHLNSPAAAALALAEVVRRLADPDTHTLLARLVPLATQHYAPGSVHRLIGLGATPDDVGNIADRDARTQLVESTREVISRSAIHEEETVLTWLDRCAIAAHRIPDLLPTVEGMLDGEGWYRCWLRFVVALVQAEAAETDRPQLALDALRHLTGDLDPFTGKPRACDLYPIQDQITDTLRRAVSLLDDDTWPTALTILREVTEGVGVSLRGQDAGPVTPDFLLALAIESTTTPARRQATRELIDHALAEGGGNRYYSILAEYRLMAARFAIVCGDTDEAEIHWNQACRLMTAYGFRRDLTIYEVLDPLPQLIAADPARARLRLAQVQSTCKQVVRHTDGKDTRSSWPQWWTLLAEADPAALTGLAVPALLQRCGHLNDLYNDALEDLWRTWHQHADPVVAGALRLALPMPFDDADQAMVERLVDIADGTGVDLPGQLLTLLLARADERPLRHPYSNGDELIAEDTARVEAINTVAARVNAPLIDAKPLVDEQDGQQDELRSLKARTRARAAAQQTAVDGFPGGANGLARAIRAWRRRPYESDALDWAPERFANIIGYRLVELAEAGDEQHAEAALHSLAGVLKPLDQTSLLASLGEGLERHGHLRLAAVAFTLVWTRTRAHDGWMNFGGQTELDSLRHATRLDADTAWTTVVSEVARVVAGSGGGSIGVSQALIHGSIAGGLCPRQRPLDLAFAAWDAAHAVIAHRTPKMTDDEKSDTSYTAPPQHVSDRLTSDINEVFGEGVIGAMAHPGQENRRRALLAFQLLLLQRTETAADALAGTLPALHEPALLSWLLSVVVDVDSVHPVVADRCQNILQRHSNSPYLTVRAFAAHILGDHASPPLLTPPDSALLPSGRLLLPDDDPLFERTAARVTFVAAAHRLTAAEELLPHIIRAVIVRVDAAMADHEHMKAIDKEANELADVRHKRWADAFTGRPALVEDALQRAASGGRAALLAAGEPPADPAAWEYSLARVLVNDPALPLAIERTRQPRPDIIMPPTAGDPVWSGAHEMANRGRWPQSADTVVTASSLAPAESCDILRTGRFRGWRIIASTEEHVVPSDWSEKDDLLRRSGLDRAMGFRQPDSQGRLFADDAAVNWFQPLTGQVVVQPDPSLVGIDHRSDLMADAPFGLGLHRPLLVPTLWLRLVLALHPVEEPFVLHDGTGPALAMITWRSHYETGTYHLPWPRTLGSALVASPEAFDKLLNWGEESLVVRELAHADPSLANAAGASSG